MEPVLSLIVPVYNLQEDLESCLLSILPQMTPQVELLLVDDGSTDQSLAICRRYESAYPNLRVFSQHNQGVSVARNVGLRRARGKYVWFVDGDDLLPTGTLQMILKEIHDNPEVEILCGNCIKFWEGEPLPPVTPFSTENLQAFHRTHGRESLLHLLKSGSFLPAAWAAIVKRELLEQHHIQFPPGWINNEDVDTALHYYLAAKNVRALSRPHYYYRQGRQGAATSGFSLRRVEDSHRMITAWLQRLRSEPLAPELAAYLKDYLAYQYAIALGSSWLCSPEERRMALALLYPHRELLKSALTPKTKEVSRLYRCVGYRATAKALSLYIRRRRKQETKEEKS